MLVLETKGQEDDQSRAKRRALGEWTQAVNQHGGFGRWSADVSYNPADIEDVLAPARRIAQNPTTTVNHQIL